MNIDEVLRTYDGSYASSYDAGFIHGYWNRESIAFQLGLIRERLQTARNWLDVACGTGWVLSQFPGVQRAGLDISAPMLAVARQRIPEVALSQRNYREPFPDWNDSWDLVTCMWWAYCLADTMTEVRELVARLADWVSPGGEVLVPLCNVRKFDRHNIRIPYVDAKVPGRAMITGVTWTWIQEDGKRHTDVMTPQVEYLAAMFREHFEVVEVIEGPLDEIGEGWRVQDVLSARRKRSVRVPGDLHGQGRVRPPGQNEWLLFTSPGNVASVEHLTTDCDTIRVAFHETVPEAPWGVQVSKSGFHLAADRYRVTFRVRSGASRPITVGASLTTPPWTGLGLYAAVAATAEWTAHALEWDVPVATDAARIHFDLAQDGAWVELSDLTLAPSR